MIARTIAIAGAFMLVVSHTPGRAESRDDWHAFQQTVVDACLESIGHRMRNVKIAVDRSGSRRFGLALLSGTYHGETGRPHLRLRQKHRGGPNSVAGSRWWNDGSAVTLFPVAPAHHLVRTLPKYQLASLIFRTASSALHTALAM